MSYVQALRRGVERDRSEDRAPTVASHPHFGRLAHYDALHGEGHWEAELSHPRTGARFTVFLPGGPNAPVQPFANAYRRLVASPDALLLRCRAALVDELVVNRRAPDGLRGVAFVLEGVTLPDDAREDGSWRAHYLAEPLGRRLTVRFEGTLVRKVVLDD